MIVVLQMDVDSNFFEPGVKKDKKKEKKEDPGSGLASTLSNAALSDFVNS